MGWEQAADRLTAVEQLPDGTPTTQAARGAIDRCSQWLTGRLTPPRGDHLMCPPRLASFRGRPRGRPRGRDNLTPTQGGCQDTAGRGVRPPPFMSPLSLLVVPAR